MFDQAYKKKLEEARRKYQDAKKISKETKTLITSATPWGIFSLLSYVNIFGDWLYALAFCAALLKDLSDFIGIGSLPAIGTVITICISIFIGFMMLLANALEKDRTLFQRTIIRYLILVFGTLLEILFGLNFVPWETFMVFIIYLFALAARKNSAEKRKKLQALNKEEMEEEYA